MTSGLAMIDCPVFGDEYRLEGFHPAAPRVDG